MQPIPDGNPTLPFVIPSEAEGSAVSDRPTNSPSALPTMHLLKKKKGTRVSLLRPGIHATNPRWKRHTPLCHPSEAEGSAVSDRPTNSSSALPTMHLRKKMKGAPGLALETWDPCNQSPMETSLSPCHPQRSRWICGAPLGCPASTGPKPPPTSTDPTEDQDRNAYPSFCRYALVVCTVCRGVIGPSGEGSNSTKTSPMTPALSTISRIAGRSTVPMPSGQ